MLALRSLLFVPGTRPDWFAKALASGADALVVDLEDAVEPGRKAEARRLVGDWLASHTPGDPAVFVRVNAPGTVWIDEDLRWVASVAAFDGVVLPKTEDASGIERVAGVAPRRRVIPLLETSRGVVGAPDILRADAEIPAVLFGAEDLTAELGIARTLEGEELLYARSRVVLAAATTGTDPIDAVWVDLKSSDALRLDAARARALGFRGKMAIHPDQIGIINEVFTPSSSEVAAAHRLIDADAQARARGDGVFRLDDRMVDAPVVKRARRMLAIADAVERRAGSRSSRD